MHQQSNSKEITQLHLIFKHWNYWKDPFRLQIRNWKELPKGKYSFGEQQPCPPEPQLSSQKLKKPHNQVPQIHRNSHSAAGLILYWVFSHKK